MSEVAHLNKERENCEKFVKLGEAIERLHANPDFKLVIMREFCIEDCARYAHTSADPALTEAQRSDAMALAQAAGHLRRWLQVNSQLARNAVTSIEEIDQALVELRTERDDEVVESEVD